MSKKELYAVSPTGSPVLGTYERTPGRAEIGWWGRAKDGSIEFEPEGYTEMFWDDQVTLEHAASGERLFLDEEGSSWRESQLRLLPEGEDAPPAPELGEPYDPSMIDLDHRELSTVLAALRLWQRDGFQDPNRDLHDVASDDGSCVPLNDTEIDKLCERLNGGG